MTKAELLESLNGETPTPEQAAMLMDMAEGDTDAFWSDDSVPGAVASEDGDDKSNESVAEDDKQQDKDPGSDAGGAGKDGQDEGMEKPGDKPGETEPEADNAVVLARDGKHTIPYEKLAQAREGERQWREKAQQAEAELQRVLGEAQQRAESGEETTLEQAKELADAADAAGIDLSLFDDFSEEGLAKGIAAIVKQQVEAQVAAQVEGRVAKALEPIQSQYQEDAEKAHQEAIYAAHPDADSLADSKEMSDWINAQPSFVREGYNRVLSEGSTKDVIELFDSFKAATGAAQPVSADDSEKTKAAAKQALDEAKNTPPASLSDIPGGKPATGDKFEVISQLDAAGMAEAMSDMSPAQIEAFLSRSM